MAAVCRSAWLRDHLCCPSCRILLDHGDAGSRCPRCGRSYLRFGGAVDFLDAETREAFGIVETENRSDHPFDGNALAIIDAATLTGGMLLDCGSGTKSEAFENVVQMDIVPFPFVDVLAVNQRIPFVDDSFDAVFSLDVLEHVEDPFACARELARVLRPGGVLYVDMPFLQGEHGYPHHYFNATRMGLQRLFRDLLEVEAHHVPESGHPVVAVYDLVKLYDDALSDEARARFRSLTVEEILARGPLAWLDDIIATGRNADSEWITASSTQALLRKSAGATSVRNGGGCRLPVTADVLPGFPNFDPTRRQKLCDQAFRSENYAPPIT